MLCQTFAWQFTHTVSLDPDDNIVSRYYYLLFTNEETFSEWINLHKLTQPVSDRSVIEIKSCLVPKSMIFPLILPEVPVLCHLFVHSSVTCSFRHSVIHSTSRHLLIACSVSGTVLGPEDTKISTTWSPLLHPNGEHRQANRQAKTHGRHA